ncbi:hypothetical protein JEU11_01240 [Paraglaciecola chathamensis]|jgi:hypothetical protein|uniref:STAS/SEC14 domain-containing protein n=1 Tax=Paraglaciecola chathamensis TaxID=368405 RepID=A0ABS0W9E6_9ALTE|nr:hypothetical protein [Paraglaciecola chathamensis]MBJ2135068.1 hypothetical protein [Paraglaciecola chathamensis]MDO6559207.1 hypothetical protein [Paraglaciecola chathamensis]|tara:strand:- start:86 stop:502 length:417 start_codon:yes stop_codon:yes gene_type:complete
MNNRTFPAHGGLKITREGQLLLIYAQGPGNTEMVLKYQKDLHDYRIKMSASPWASLTIFSGEPLLPPEASKLMVDSIKQAQGLNLVANAIIFDNVQCKTISQQFWTDILQQTTLKHGFFDDEQKAKAWLREEVANTQG